MKAIAILNLKGGVGKTVTAVNVAAILAGENKKRVLLIDCDSQCNASMFFDVSTDVTEANTLTELLSSPCPEYCEDYIQRTEVDGLSMIAASDGLMDLDVRKLADGQASATVLRDLCAEMAAQKAYDYVIFDCPPAFNAASAAALVAADEVIIPVKLDAFSLAGMGNLLRQVQNMRKINRDLRIAGILITMWKPIKSNVEALEALHDYLAGIPIFKTRIRRTDKIAESTFRGEAITVYSPHAAAAVDYRRFCRELLREEGQ